MCRERLVAEFMQTDDLELTAYERARVEGIAKRMDATLMSLYRRSDGLYAFVVDGGGGEHLGVRIVRTLPPPRIP